MSARISGNHHILLPVSFSVARFFPQFTLGGHQRRSIFLLANTGTQFITSSFDSRTVLAFYLAEIFNSEKGTIGIILSCYTIAALCIRPFSGYLLDTFARKPLYLLAYFLFTAAFGGYLLAGTLTLFTLIRIFHGLAFGTVTVAGNTVVIDIMPSSRRGEGLGYYGMMNNTAMSIGPMAK